ncbi:MAG: hypothetical protein Q4B58_04415 [Bacteroidales bacterium]|nr:hypothetical protein [Bacteroidales bacterium]
MKYIEYVAYLLVLISAMIGFSHHEIACYMMAVGASALCLLHWREKYEGKNLRLKRIMRIRHFIGVIWLVASYYMFKEGNYWPVIILIAVVLEYYTIWIINREEKKEK